MEAEETFTDFMVRCMEGEDHVVSATFLVRRADQTIGYKCFKQEFADTIGLLRVAALSIENDLVAGWREDR